MTDIVSRLRASNTNGAMCDEAANEIERLRKPHAMTYQVRIIRSDKGHTHIWQYRTRAESPHEAVVSALGLRLTNNEAEDFDLIEVYPLEKE
jgi:hypothetical protein